MPIELLDLNVGHSLIRSNKPSILPMEAIDRVQKEQTREDIKQFGLFDSSTPNYYTYYPEVKPEDLNPQDADFVYPVFRLLSSIVIYPTQLAIDFTEGNVLKNSMPLLKGQSLYVDHEMTTGNVMGTILDVVWQEAYTTDGVKVPAGINGLLMIDGKSNPRIARAVMMNPPSIHSSSVQIQFAWKPSHKFKDMQEFHSKLGTYDSKGVLIRKVVEEILRYAENSLVPHGMDPFAKKLSNGKIVLAKSAAKVYSMQFSEKQLQKNPFLSVTTSPDHQIYQQALMNFSEIIDTTNAINTTEQILKDQVMFEQMLEALGFTAEQFADEASLVAHIQSQSQALTEAETQVTTLTEQVNTLTEAVTTHEAEITQLTEQVTNLTTERDNLLELSTREITAVREDAKKFYNLLKGDKADAVILTSIEAMDSVAATAFRDDYRNQYEVAVPLTCGDCHSTNVSRKTSENPGKPEKQDFMANIRDKAAKKSNEAFVKS